MSLLLLLKTRVITHAEFRSICCGLWATSRVSLWIGVRVVREEGALALSKEMRVFALKRLCDWLTRFLFVELSFGALLWIGVTRRECGAERAVVAPIVGRAPR